MEAEAVVEAVIEAAGKIGDCVQAIDSAQPLECCLPPRQQPRGPHLRYSGHVWRPVALPSHDLFRHTAGLPEHGAVKAQSLH